MNKLQRVRLPVLLGVLAMIGAGAGLAAAQPPDDAGEIEASSYEVDCAAMPETSAREASRLRGCYVTEIESAPADASQEEIAEAEVAALCAAIADPAEKPDACWLFPDEGDEQ